MLKTAFITIQSINQSKLKFIVFFSLQVKDRSWNFAKYQCLTVEEKYKKGFQPMEEKKKKKNENNHKKLFERNNLINNAIRLIRGVIRQKKKM